MKRKAFAALAAVCLVLCLILAGCGTVSEEDYPPLEKVDDTRNGQQQHVFDAVSRR